MNLCLVASFYCSSFPSSHIIFYCQGFSSFKLEVMNVPNKYLECVKFPYKHDTYHALIDHIL